MNVTKKELNKYFREPYVMQDFFVVETLNVAFSIIESIYNEEKDKFQFNVSLKDMRENIFKETLDFHEKCLNCHLQCFDNYHRRIPQNSYEQLNLDYTLLPKQFQKTTAGHLYMLELSASIFYGACSSIDDEETKIYLQNSIFYNLIDYYTDNCIRHCRYKCFKHCNKDAYDNIHSIISQE